MLGVHSDIWVVSFVCEEQGDTGHGTRGIIVGKFGEWE